MLEFFCCHLVVFYSITTENFKPLGWALITFPPAPEFIYIILEV